MIVEELKTVIMTESAYKDFQFMLKSMYEKKVTLYLTEDNLVKIFLAKEYKPEDWILKEYN